MAENLVTVSAEQISKAKAAGLQNVDTAAKVADEVTDIIFYQLCALLEKESNGRNVYGHDAGGALSGFPGAVNKENFAVFRWLVFTKGQTSNGVGPMQLTYKGFFTDMEADGLKPWDVHDNILYGGKLWTGYYRVARAAGLTVSEAIKNAGLRYNGSSAYGERLLVIMNKWRDLVGISDAKS
jgi:hypothetical protein